MDANVEAPYASHQRGSNENVGGFTKGIESNHASAQRVRRAAGKTSMMPRKLLGGKQRTALYLLLALSVL